MNDIGSVHIDTTLPLFFDAYQAIRATGSFILIDPISNATVAAGMIEGAVEDTVQPITLAGFDKRVSAEERRHRYGHSAAAVWLSRLRVAELVERALINHDWHVQLIETANLPRQGLHEVARALHQAGMIVVLVSVGNAAQQQSVRTIFGDENFLSIGDDPSTDLELATKILQQLHAWRDGRGTLQKEGR